MFNKPWHVNFYHFYVCVCVLIIAFYFTLIGAQSPILIYVFRLFALSLFTLFAMCKVCFVCIFIANKSKCISINKYWFGTKQMRQRNKRKKNSYTKTWRLSTKNADDFIRWNIFYFCVDKKKTIFGTVSNSMSVNRTPLQVYRRIGNCVRGFLCTLITHTRTHSKQFRWFCSHFPPCLA